MSKSIKKILSGFLFAVTILFVFLFSVSIDVAAVNKTTIIDTDLQLRSVVSNGDMVYISTVPYAYGYAGYIDGASFGFSGSLGDSKILVDISDNAFDSIPEGATVVSATLSIYQYAAPSANTKFQCNMIADSWSVDEYSQTNRSEGYTRASQLGIEYLSLSASISGWNSFDITTAVDAWLNGISEQNGLMITGQYGTSSEIGGAFVTNTSVDNIAGQATYFTYRPYITVDWVCPHSGETYFRDTVEATCTSVGYKGDTYCADCDEKIVDGEEIPKTEHTMGEWYTSVMPSPNSTGEKKRECKHCDYFETEVMDAVPSITENGYKYYVVDDLAYITGTPRPEELIVPERLGGYTVVYISGVGSSTDNYTIKSIVLPDTITDISSYAFMRCRNLKTIKLPANLKVIGAFAFNICTSLETVVLPDNVEIIAEYAFSYCESLNGIIIPNSLTTLGESAFYGCRSLESIEIPETVTNIGRVLFAGCSNLKNVKLADTITNLKDQTFFDCASLESIILPKALTQIYKQMFTNCENLRGITIYNDARTIYNDAFTNCDRLRDVFYHGTKYEFDTIARGFGGTCRDFREIATIYYLHTAEYGKVISTTETCDGGGVTTFECECGYIWTEKTNGLGHDFGEYVCNIDNTHYRVCQVDGCGYIETKNCSSLDWTIINEPTCTEEGKKLYKCKCGKEYEGSIRSNGHGLGNWHISPIQRFSDKVMQSRECKRCDYYEERESQAEPYLSGVCGVNGNNVLWKYYSEGILVLIGEGEMKNYSSSGTSPWYSIRTSIDTVIVGNGITNVGDWAFYNCTYLKEVYLSDSVTAIDWGAFDTCTSLEYIDLPKSLIDLGQNCFSDCTKLQAIILPENLEYISSFVFSGCSKLEKISILSDKLTYIGYDLLNNTAYYNKTANWIDDILYVDDYLLEAKTTINGSKVVKENTRLMAASAFSGCTSLKSITIPEGIKNILNGTFSGCTSLETVVLPNSLCYIKTNSFAGCSSLSQIELSENLIEIGERAFSGCKGLLEIFIPNSVNKIYSDAFNGCSSLTNVKIGSGVTSISDTAFFSCTSLKNFVVDKNNTHYSNDDFGILYNKDKSTLVFYPIGKDNVSIEILSGVKSIGARAFQGCVNLTEVVISSDVTSIDGFAFFNCTNLRSLVIPSSLTRISLAFNDLSDSAVVHFLGTLEDWYNIEHLSIFGKVESSINVEQIHFDAYYDENLSTCLEDGHSYGVYCHTCGWVTGEITPPNGHEMDIWRFSKWIDSNIIEENKICLNCEYFETRTVESVINKQGEISTETGVLFWSLYDNGLLYISGIGAMPDYKVNKYAPWYLYRDQITSVVVEEGVTSIGDLAFYKCNNITDIQLPDTIERIGKYAFNGCDSIVSMYIPSSVNAIDSKAFHSCNALAEFIVSADNESYTSLDGVLYNKDMSELVKYPLAKDDLEFIIPDTVFSIAESAFNGCEYLTEISVDQNIEIIKDSAFYNCKNLETVYLGESVKTIEPYAFYNCQALTAISFANSDITIGDWAFYKCNSLDEVNYAGSMEEWSLYNFGNDNKPLKKVSVNCEINGTSAEPASIMMFGMRRTVQEHEHNYESVTFTPTCTNAGYTAYTCSGCGDSYRGDETVALGHTEITISGKASTCFEEGLTDGVKCEDCGELIIVQEKINKLEHVDSNDDSKCDYGCGFEFFDSYTSTENSNGCDCYCHKSGFIGFIWKVIIFFNKLFGMNKTCACDVTHY